MCLHRPTGNGKTACFGIGMLSWHDLIGFRIRAMVALQAADLLISVIARIILRQPSNADFNRMHDAMFIPSKRLFLLIFKTRSFTNIHEQTCNTSHKTDKQYTGTQA